MKKVIIYVFVVMTMAVTSCGSSKKALEAQNQMLMQKVMQQEQQQQPINDPIGKLVEMPCIDESMDSDDFFADLGTGLHLNQQSARTAALEAAKMMIRSKLGGFVSGLSTGYSRVVAGEASSQKVQSIMESELPMVVEKMLNDAQKTCEKMYHTQDGRWQSYIAIRIPKADMLNNMADALSKNEELEIEFNRDQFRKYAEEKMKQMNEAKKNAGK